MPVQITRRIGTPVNATGALTAGQHTPVNATSGAVTMTLPSTANAGAHLSIEKTDTSANTVTISGSIRGTTTTLTLYWANESIELIADNANSWWPIAGHKTKTALDAAYFNVLGTASNPVTNASATRPTGLTRVYWYTATQPTNWINGDVWEVTQ